MYTTAIIPLACTFILPPQHASLLLVLSCIIIAAVFLLSLYYYRYNTTVSLLLHTRMSAYNGGGARTCDSKYNCNCCHIVITEPFQMWVATFALLVQLFTPREKRGIFIVLCVRLLPPLYFCTRGHISERIFTIFVSGWMAMMKCKCAYTRATLERHGEE